MSHVHIICHTKNVIEIFFTLLRCQYCDKGLINKQELDQHILIHHTDHSKRPFKCETCGMAFVLKVCIQYHIHGLSSEGF